jgi:hypothetical protein
MFNKDRIFWWAAGIFVLAIIIFAVTGEQLWLSLMIASYLLRPTLASLGVARRLVDERQMSIHYRSGNIAFAAMMIAAVAMAVNLRAHDDPNWDVYNAVIIIGLATKALFNVLFAKNYRDGAVRIIIAVGLMVTLFVTMENGLSWGTLIEGAPGFIIIGIGLLAKRYPRVVGVFVFAVTTVLFFVVLFLGKGSTSTQITTAIILCVPLYIAGLCLFARDGEECELSEDGTSPSIIAE